MDQRFSLLETSRPAATATRPGDRRRRRGLPALLLAGTFLALLLPHAATLAQAPPVNPAQQLLEQERIRAAVEAAFSHYYQPAGDGNVKNDNMVAAADMLVELGPAAVPLLANELRQALPYNYTFVAYALGRIGGAEAEAALREAVTDVGQQSGDDATTRRAWACYALAMMGELDALDLFNQPNQLAAGLWIHMDVSALEAAALFLAPASVPVLHAQLDRYAQDEQLARERSHVINALRRIAHPDSLPKIIQLLDDNDPQVRRQAVDALQAFETPLATAALLRRVKEEPLPHVRFAAAWSLRQIAPKGMDAEFTELLEKEYDVTVRGVLYHLVALGGDPQAFTVLKGYLGRPDPRDRRELIAAIRRLRDPETINVIRAALQDDDAHVMKQAAGALRELGGEKATLALLEQIDSGNWLRARWSLEQLVAQREARAIPRVIARLARELRDPVMNPLDREKIYTLGDALIGLRHAGNIDDLREGIARQGDGNLKAYLASWVEQHRTLQANADDVTRWIATLTTDDPRLRHLAYQMLSELGGEAAATALVAAFGRVDPGEGVAILRALGNTETDAARGLLERILTQPAFDPVERLELREMAAYSARRIGGKRMADALRAAVERRHGRDGKVLMYLLLTEGEAAFPDYENQRVESLRYLKWSRGNEQETLQRLVADLRAGRSLQFYDLPPDEFDFRRPV